MDCKQKNARKVLKTVGNDKYVNAVFTLMKRSNALVLCGKNQDFNDTEVRLLSEIIAADQQGKRLISTQLAKMLGITRSAISQIVNRLEQRDMVKRVPDDVDRKIAYVVATDKAIALYLEVCEKLQDFMGECVKKFGAENFETMCTLFGKFIDIVDEEKNTYMSNGRI